MVPSGLNAATDNAKLTIAGKDQRVRIRGVGQMNGSDTSAADEGILGGIDRTAFLLALGTFAIGTDAFIIAGVLPEISTSLSSSVGATGLVVSVFSLAYAAGSPIVSFLSARWRRSTVLVGGLGVFALANLLSAASPSLIILLASRILAALSAGLVAPASYALASTLGASRNRGKNLAVIAAGFTSAMVLGVPIGVFLSQYGGWRSSLIFVTVLGAIAAASMFWVGVPESQSQKAAPALRDQLRVVAKTQTIFALAPFLIWSIANFGLYTFIAVILRRTLPATVVPLLLLLFGLGAVAGNFMGGVLSDRFGTRKPIMICLTLLICALAGIEFTSSSLIAAGMNMIAWAILMAALFTLQQQKVILVDPAQSNLLLALNNSALYLGAAIGSAAFGAIISRMSLAVVSPISAGAAALSLGALLFMPLRDQETPPSDYTESTGRAHSLSVPVVQTRTAPPTGEVAQ
jgi:MFS transporter, DHA1 family, inner membrane transport protein